MKRAMVYIFMIFVALSATARTDESAAKSTDAHQQLHEILQRPMYQAWQLRQKGHIPDVDVNIPTGWTHWIKDILHSIGDFFSWLFRSSGSSSSGGISIGNSLPTILQILAWLAVGIALIFCAIFIIRFLSKTQLPIPTANILSRQQVKAALESGDALAMTSAQWMDEARRLAEEQNFRAVYRALYLALLSGLHTVGKIEHSRNRTNWTYVEHYRGPVDERTTFANLTELFDRVWYGRKDAQGQDLQQLRNQVALLTRQEGQP